MKTTKITKKNILIIDEDPSILSLFTFMLKQVGHNTLTASSQREALEISKSDKHIELTFIDGKIAELNNHKTYIELKKIRPNTPCIFMLSYSDKKRTEKILKLRPYSTIFKPFDVEEVLSMINYILK